MVGKGAWDTPVSSTHWVGGGGSGLHASWYAYFLYAKGDTKPMDEAGLTVPMVISAFLLHFAWPPWLTVIFTARGHTGLSSGRTLGPDTS